MKKILLLGFILLSTVLSNAQKCNFLINETDEITGEKMVQTDFVKVNKKLSSKYYFSHSFVLGEGHYFLAMKLTGGGQSLYISQGNQLILKLNDDTLLTFEASKSFKTKFNTVSGVLYSYIIPLYGITKEQLEQISNTGVKFIRMETSEHFYDSDVTEKDNKKMKHSISCLLKE